MKNIITFAQAKTHVDEFISYLQSEGYKASTLKIIRQNVRFFLNSEKDENQQLSEESIFSFVSQHYDPISQHSRYNSMLGSCRKFLYHLLDEKLTKVHTAPTVTDLNEEFRKHIESYIDGQRISNCESTLSCKQDTLIKFSLFLSQLGIKSFTEINAEIVLSYLYDRTPEISTRIRPFLRYLFTNKIINRDFSVLINTVKRPHKLPTVYSEEELTLLIKMIDGESLIAKRNKAIVLIAATTGLRSCDIVNLKYDDFCFEKSSVSIIQAKTGVPLTLPINDETASAVRNYYESRPDSKFSNLFINQNAPYNPISTGIIRYILRNAFANANINIEGKRHGPHALRSSLASAMVNSGISYEIVQHQLGHTSDMSLKHYVRFDIEKLRLCALATPCTTGNFKRWLEGDL